MRLLCVMGALGMLAVATGCRDGVTPFNAEDRPRTGTEEVRQITFSRSDDQAPRWSVNGDTIYYTTEAAPVIPRVSWELKAIPADGGVAVPVRIGFESTGGAAMSVSSTGSAAYAVPRMRTPGPLCPGIQECPDGKPDELPHLLGVSIGVRRVDLGAGGVDAVWTRIRNDALRYGTGTPLSIYVTMDPFQWLVAETRGLIYRPSWSPDGSRLVFADGRQLHVWTPQEDRRVAIEGVNDAAYAAWSPDGQWIAYTQLLARSLVGSSCRFVVEWPVAKCTVNYSYRSLRGTNVALVRPDGSESRDLGSGSAPAWAPDGSGVYVSRPDGIWWLPLSGGRDSRLGGTEGCAEPAISPDGTRLVASCIRDGTDYDLWVFRIRQGGP